NKEDELRWIISDLKSAGVKVYIDDQDENGTKGEEDEGVDSYDFAIGLYAAKLHGRLSP
ncbi:hypothetical protein TorRG33x02_160210, partial [Trema orientale]